MTDPLDGMLDEDLDALLDGTPGASSGSDDVQEMPDGATGGDGEPVAAAAGGADRGTRGADEPSEVWLSPEPVEGRPGYDDARYEIVIDHGDGRAVLVEPGSTYEDEKYQLLGDEPSIGVDGYDERARVEPASPSTLESMAASVTAGTISAGFMTAEAGLEAFYNGLRGLVNLVD